MGNGSWGLRGQGGGCDHNHSHPAQVIMATNRADTLDPALLRPGRLDRKIEFPLPDRRQKRLIFSTITSKMNLSEEVDLEDCILWGQGRRYLAATFPGWLGPAQSPPGGRAGKSDEGSRGRLQWLGRDGSLAPSPA